jgi:hypothetical protein
MKTETIAVTDSLLTPNSVNRMRCQTT